MCWSKQSLLQPSCVNTKLIKCDSKLKLIDWLPIKNRPREGLRIRLHVGNLSSFINIYLMLTLCGLDTEGSFRTPPRLYENILIDVDTDAHSVNAVRLFSLNCGLLCDSLCSSSAVADVGKLFALSALTAPRVPLCLSDGLLHPPTSLLASHFKQHWKSLNANTLHAVVFNHSSWSALWMLCLLHCDEAKRPQQVHV